jgi:hypothetical protein
MRVTVRWLSGVSINSHFLLERCKQWVVRGPHLPPDRYTSWIAGICLKVTGASGP